MGHILVADDDPDLSDLIALSLQRADHDVHVVQDGAAAVDAAATGQFDAIILDFHMPERTGAEAAREIRKQSRCATVPIVLLTASATPAEIREALESGVDVYLPKPFSPKSLRERLEDLLLNGRPERSAS